MYTPARLLTLTLLALQSKVLFSRKSVLILKSQQNNHWFIVFLIVIKPPTYIYTEPQNILKHSWSHCCTHSFLSDVLKACDTCLSAVVSSDALIYNKIHYYLLCTPSNLCSHHWLSLLHLTILLPTCPCQTPHFPTYTRCCWLDVRSYQ